MNGQIVYTKESEENDLVENINKIPHLIAHFNDSVLNLHWP